MWLRALNDPQPPASVGQGLKYLVKTHLLWILIPVLPCKRLVSALALPFSPTRWSTRSILWSVKFTAGFVALFLMSVYWDSYSNLGIDVSEDNSLFSGWHLCGYAFSWMATVEGTAKKGLSRFVGTALGGFAAWLGIIVASGSYDDDSEVNPYGLVAWLTFWTVVVSFFALEPGAAAAFGSSHDHGTPIMYFSLTQALIALEVYSGAGSKGDITVNRMVATLSGVAMAMVFMAIPPYVAGGDPVHTRDYLLKLNDTFQSLLEAVVGTEEFDEKEERALLQTASESGQEAFFLLKDASTLKKLPFFQVNENIKPLLEDMTVTESYISHLLDYVAVARGNEEESKKLSASAKAVQEILNKTNGKTSGKSNGEESDEEVETACTPENHGKGSRDLLMLGPTLHTLFDRLKEHERALDQLDDVLY
jgi:hypothetical protein